jgi:protein TonB
MKMIRLFATAALLSGLAFGQKKLTHGEAVANAQSRVNPAYPASAKQLRLEGSVEIEVSISESGAVEKAEAVSGNPILARAAVDAVKQWKFKSFGGPVQAVLQFAFKL